MENKLDYSLRKATDMDIGELTALIGQSVRELQKDDYTPRQLEGALESVYGVDTQLIADGTYFVVETQLAGAERPQIIGCGGWSKRKTLYGGDQWHKRQDGLLDARIDAAKIRAFFIKPGFTRLGLGSTILAHCEQEAISQGFSQFEMGATLTGVALYAARGYESMESASVPLANGESLPIVRMTKSMKPVDLLTET